MNIYDIAKLSGVSIATVSRVVNNSPKVSDKTRAKVHKIMEEVGYTPNIFARGLGLNSMQTIGILCPDVADLYMASAVSYLERKLNQYGYDCILGCTGDEQKNRENYVKLFLSKKIDALVMIGSTYAGKSGSEDEIQYIVEASKEVPIFTINSFIPGDHIFCLYSDDDQAAYDITTSFINQGKQNILFLYNSQSFSGTQKRLGYEKAHREAGLPIRGDMIFFTSHGMNETKDLLLLNQSLVFDAVLASEDFLAVSVLKYAKTKGLRIPEDIAVVGYNNSNYAICSEPELTSIDNKNATLCSLTVDHLIGLLEEGIIPKKSVKVPYHIIKRNTTTF